MGSFCAVGGWQGRQDGRGTGNWVRFAGLGCGGTFGVRELGSFRRSSFWLLAIGCWPGRNWVRFAYLHAHRSGGNPDFEIPGLKRDATVGWAPACNSSCLKGHIQLSGIIPESSVYVKHIFELSADFADFRRFLEEARWGFGLREKTAGKTARLNRGGGGGLIDDFGFYILY